MNLPKDHPAWHARYFYITEEILLYSHKSCSSSVHLINTIFLVSPLKMISARTCFSVVIQMMHPTATQFHQIEGLVVGKNISMGDLKGALEMIIQNVWCRNCLRPSYFPFTEPQLKTCHASSVEVKDVTYAKDRLIDPWCWYGSPTSAWDVRCWFWKNIQVSPLVWSRTYCCFAMVSTTSSFYQGDVRSQNSLNKV